MAKAGDELIYPVTGLRTVFRKTAQDTGGELLQVDCIGEPGWTTGPDHVALFEGALGRTLNILSQQPTPLFGG